MQLFRERSRCMLKVGALVLTIEGKVKQKDIKKLTSDFQLDENQGWFFVDYAVKEVPLNSKFDVLLEGESKRLIFGPNRSFIKLVTILDQFGNRLPAISEGHKSICKLEFHPTIPAALKKIAFLDGWDYNPEAIYIVHHADVELATPDKVVNDLYRIVFIHLKTTFSKNHNQPIYRKDLIDFLKKSFKTHSESADQILNALMQLGKVTQTDNSSLEFAELDD